MNTEYTTTEDGQLATVNVQPVDWQAQYMEKDRLQLAKEIYTASIDTQIAVIDAIFAEAQSRGVVIPAQENPNGTE